MADDATILHADVDAFFAAVEQRDDPRLRGRPVIVGGGVVLSSSYEARARGVRTAMPGRRALRLCPDAVVVPPRMRAYADASDAVYRVFDDTSPVVEGLSIDEAFLDVRGMERIAGSPTQIAARLRREVRARVGLAVTVGVARTKFLAKVASGVAKPDGLLVVPPGTELAFLRPLPVERLWGVGDATAERLRGRGLCTVADVARASRSDLVGLLGRAAGGHLHALARNDDPRPVRPRQRRRSVGAQRALGRGPHSPGDLDAALVGLVDRVTRRMRASGRRGRTVVLRLRLGDFARISRSRTLRSATAQSHAVLVVARGLLAESALLVRERGVTLIGVAVTNLDPDGAQLALSVDRPDRDALDEAVDRVRDRFGTSAVGRAVLLGRGERPLPPLLE